MINTKWSLKKGNLVKVISGKHKGTIGEILKIHKHKESLTVKGVNIKKKHIKPKKTEQGAVLWFESPIHKSNVILHHPTTLAKL